MIDAQKPDHISLTSLVTRLRDGRFVIPDFQREFEWGPGDISALLRSIFLDYYIGSLLLWRGKKENFEALACESIYGFEGNGSPEYIVLDGQQRLTAMYYAFLAPDKPAPKRKNRFLYFIRVNQFMDECYDEAFVYDWTTKGMNLLSDQTGQFEEHMFPLAVIGMGGWELPNWVQGYEKYWEDKLSASRDAGDEKSVQAAARHVKNARAFGKHLKNITEQYQITYIELDSDLELDKVCDIFTQINSRGIRLDVFDLINALLRPKGLQLKHLWRQAEPRLNFVETERLNVYVLQVMSILLQTYCSPKYLYYLLPSQEKKIRREDGSLHREVLVANVADFEMLWNQAVNALEKAISLLRHPQEYGAISSRYLPYVSILPAFSALQTAARNLPASQQLDAQRKIRYWYWASVFTNRYSGSVESTTARDYIDTKAWFEDNAAEPPLISEFKSQFRNIDLKRETKRGSSIYNGIFNLLVLNGARDWMTGSVPQYGDLDDHHIVPKAKGKDYARKTSIDSILNRTPLSAETNRNVICDRLPNEYLPELIKANGEDKVRAILETHFISPIAFDILLRDPFTPEDFEAFIAERERTLKEAIEDLLVKERLDLSPQLRRLDIQIEDIELALRNMIVSTLERVSGELPPHVQKKIGNRMAKAARKDPALVDSRNAELIDKLQYADLRELQDIILNKSLWPYFQEQFVNKDTLVKRFDQLCTLRNGIRHSRAVDEITRKEGEAAILWFKKVLGL